MVLDVGGGRDINDDKTKRMAENRKAERRKSFSLKFIRKQLKAYKLLCNVAESIILS